MSLSQMASLIGAGALGGIFSVLGLWAVSEIWAGWQSFAFFTFSWDKLYYVTFWGGVLGLVYWLPLTFSKPVVAGVCGAALGLIYLSAYRWNGWAIGDLNPVDFGQGEWVTIAVFALIWGLVTAKTN
jgi:hypothetical protein